MTLNHLDVVRQVYAKTPAEKTVVGALVFTVRVIQALNHLFPDERAGLLLKNAGENFVPYTTKFGDKQVSASRICYPDLKLYKVLNDVPTTNGAQWLDDGYAAVGGYIGGYLEVLPDEIPVIVVDPPPIVVPPIPLDRFVQHALLIEGLQVELIHKIENLVDGLAGDRLVIDVIAARQKAGLVVPYLGLAKPPA